MKILKMYFKHVSLGFVFFLLILIGVTSFIENEEARLERSKASLNKSSQEKSVLGCTCGCPCKKEVE